MSDEPTPRPCLSDFDFITTALDPPREFSQDISLMGGMTQFTAPELMTRGGKRAQPTRRGDIYAFGSVILQVCEQDHECRPFLFILSSGPHG